MPDFWSRLGQPQPEVPRTGAWWQERDPYQGVTNPAPQPRSGNRSESDIKQLRKLGHQNISWDDAETIATYDLATKAKYQNECPECGSGNFLPAGMRVGSTVMSTDKCFDCGHSARGPEPAIGGRGGGGLATRQIDTGGGGGNMFMKFRGIPAGYAPRT
jgi:hypothetical protein